MISVVEMLVDRVVALDAAVFWLSVIVWVLLAACAGGIAQGKGYSGAGYFVLGLLLSPIIGVLAAFILNDRRADRIAALEARLGPAPDAQGADAAPVVRKEASTTALALAGFVVVSLLIVGGLFLFRGIPR